MKPREILRRTNRSGFNIAGRKTFMGKTLSSKGIELE